MMRAGAPILVTGSHRSGTTWVGRILSTSPDLFYIHEPFHPHARPGISSPALPFWFTDLDYLESQVYRDSFQSLVSLKYKTRAAFIHARSIRDIYRIIRDVPQFVFARRSGKRALFKDPIAVFSVPWLVREFQCQPVILIRHPLSFYYSIARKGWAHDFNHFVSQPGLMATFPEGLQRRIERYTRQAPSLIQQSCLLWNLIYHRVNEYRQRFPQWLYITHEQLCENPLQHFSKIFSYCNIPMTQKIIKRIQHSSDSGTVRVKGRRRESLRRDSHTLAWSYLYHAPPEIKSQVRTLTEEVCSLYYEQSLWKVPNT